MVENRQLNNCSNQHKSSGAAKVTSGKEQGSGNALDKGQQLNIFQLVSNRSMGSNSIIPTATTAHGDSKKTGNK